MAETPDPGGITWRSHPLLDDWPRSLLAPAALLGIAGLVLCAGFGIFLAALSLGLLIVALRRYFLPTHHALSRDGVRTTFLGASRSMKWSDFNNYYPHDIGVHLTPLTRPGALDSFRGTFLRFTDNREEVLRLVENHIRKA